MGDQPVAEVSTCNNTHHSQETNVHTSGEIETRNPSKRAATGLRLRPRGHRVGTVIINPLAYTDVPETAGLARSINPLAYTDVPETAGLARSINP